VDLSIRETDIDPCVQPQFVKSPDTEHYTFEAVLLLAILANFHKSDAAKLNPYLKCIQDTQDKVGYILNLTIRN
jgi:hypothetical protein